MDLWPRTASVDGGHDGGMAKAQGTVSIGVFVVGLAMALVGPVTRQDAMWIHRVAGSGHRIGWRFQETRGRSG